MLTTTLATVRDGQIELIEDLALPEGATVLVTILPDGEERGFWAAVSAHSLDVIWDNAEDDVYGQLSAADVRQLEQSLRAWPGL